MKAWVRRWVRRLSTKIFGIVVPCGGCGVELPIKATTCPECGADPRVIVEACQRCDGQGEVYSISGGTLLCTCPRCGGNKVTETEIGAARWRSLKRCIEIGILTEGKVGDAIIEDLG